MICEREERVSELSVKKCAFNKYGLNGAIKPNKLVHNKSISVL